MLNEEGEKSIKDFANAWWSSIKGQTNKAILKCDSQKEIEVTEYTIADTLINEVKEHKHKSYRLICPNGFISPVLFSIEN